MIELILSEPEVPNFVRLYVDLSRHSQLQIQIAITTARPGRLHENVTVSGRVEIDADCGAEFDAIPGHPAGLVWEFSRKILFKPKPQPILRDITMPGKDAQFLATVDAKCSHLTTHPQPEVFSMKSPELISFR